MTGASVCVDYLVPVLIEGYHGFSLLALDKLAKTLRLEMLAKPQSLLHCIILHLLNSIICPQSDSKQLSTDVPHICSDIPT